MFLSVTLLLGLMLGTAGAVAKEMLNSGFTMTKQVEEILGLPVLASVNRLTDRDLLIDGATVPIYEYPGLRPLSRFSEAIRALRSGVHMTDVDHPPKVIQFSSAVPREGKTTIALSVCRSAAMSKMKVLLIDADMRHPSASRMYNLDKAPGLVDLLLGEVAEGDVIRFQDKAGYWILPGGSKTQTPTDLLNSDRMKSLMSGFKEKYDLVVIDTSPIGPVVDAVVVSQLADKVVLVVRWASTARELVKECVQQLSGHKRIAGVVLNIVNDRQAQKYGKYAYSYYYRTHHYGSYYAE
jgi:capsular exopolysaccharide synthesis family protein